MGDAYLLVCYMRSWGDTPVEVHHATAREALHHMIREIYSLLPNIKLKIVPHGTKVKPFMGPGAAQILRRETNRPNFTPFPDWNLPIYPGLPKKYSVLAPISGKPWEKNRSMPQREIDRALKELKEPVVMIGTKNPKVNGVVDLSGKTTIPEALSIISGASAFSGFQGMLAYMALSQKVPSYVYVNGEGQYLSFRGRMMRKWVKYCLDIRDRNGK